MTKNLLYLFLLGSIFLTSCETEIDSIAEYKDITVVYGLLNPNETDHYIRITKAFSGEGNAYDLAANANNFYYADGEISVTIDEYDASGVFKKSFSLIRVDVSGVIPKDDGTFDNSQNVLYKFTEPNLNQNYTYKLKIVHPKLGKEVTSETKLANNPIIGNQAKIETIKLSNGSVPLSHTFEIKSSLNSGRIKVNFIFNYAEHYTNTNDTAINKQIKISLGEQQTTTNNGGEVLYFTLDGTQLFAALQNNIQVNTSFIKSRSIGNVTLEVIAAGTDLSTYITVNEPSTSINQNKPEFTNLNNGLGVFSSRNTKILYPIAYEKYLSNPFTSEDYYLFNKDGAVNLDDATIKHILNLGLDFCDARNISGLHAPRCIDALGTSYWNTINP